MKKIFNLFSLISVGFLNAQSPSLKAWTLDQLTNDTVISITNGMVISYTTGPSSVESVKVKFKNISSTNTNTYSVIRADLVLNPGAKAHFCFGDLGSCYDETIFEPSTDFSILGPGANTTGGKHLILDFDETSTIGYSAIYYKLFNLPMGKTGADTLSFTVKYNQYLSVNENTNVLETVSNIYPNPSTNNANITVVLAHESPVKVQVYNSLGSLVYNGAEQKLAGKSKLAVDCSNLNSGLYFITVTAGNSKITRRLIVNK